MAKKIRKKTTKNKRKDIQAKTQLVMSGIILDYAEPLLRDCHGIEEQKKAILLAITCWNMSFLSEDEQQDAIDRALNDSLSTDNTAKVLEIMRVMIKRKNDVFPDMNRFILNYEITEGEKNDFHLMVASVITQPEEPDSFT